jgi:uncharacterized protein (TIRG00374 family)
MKKRWLFFFLKVFIALATMIILFTKLNVTEIRSAFQDPENPFLILFAFLLLMPNLFIQWYRWHFLLCTIHSKVRITESLCSFFGGMVVGFITPGRIGEVGRSLFLDKVNRLQALGLVFLDKFYSFVIILVGGMWGIVFLLSYSFDYAAFIVWPLCMIALLITLSGLTVVVHPQWIRNLLYNLSLIFPYRDKIRRFTGFMDRFSRERARFFLALSSLLYVIYILQFCLLAFAFQRIAWTTALSATTSTFFAKTLLPISLADLGIREGAAVYFFLKFQVERATAFNSSILLFAINVLIPSVVGLFFLPRLGWREVENSNPS